MKYLQTYEKFHLGEISDKIVDYPSKYILNKIEKKLEEKSDEEKLLLINKILSIGDDIKNYTFSAAMGSLLFSIFDININEISAGLFILSFVVSWIWNHMKHELKDKKTEIKSLLSKINNLD